MRPIDGDALVYELTEMVRHSTGEYKNGIAAARLVAMDAPTIGGWISVKDRQPKDGQDVLAYLNNGEESRIAPCNFYKGVWYDCTMNCIAVIEDVTHWCSLPEPPEEVTGDDD